MKNKLILSLASVIAGIINGFIGTGGGIILYFTLKFLNKNAEDNKNNPDNDRMKDIMAMIVASVIPMSIVSAVIYMIKGKMIYNELAIYLPAALIGGIIGAVLLDKLKFKIVKKIFAAMIIYAGVRMIVG